MAPVPLYRYLTTSKFKQPALDSSYIIDSTPPPPRNKRNRHFAATDIVGIEAVDALSYNDFMKIGGEVLQREFHLDKYVPPSYPPRFLRNEAHLQHEIFVNMMLMIERALKASHPNVVVDTGRVYPGNSNAGRPDISFYEYDADEAIEKMRLVLQVKLSANWRSSWRDAPRHKSSGETDIRWWEYRQGLSEVHFQMDRFDTKFGGILTDVELVIIERTDEYGSLKVYGPIAHGAHGNFTIADGRPTVALALWCMATREDGFMPGHKNAGSEFQAISSDDDVEMPQVHLEKHLNLQIVFKGRDFQVERVLQQRPISIVFLVKRQDGERFIIKIYPKRFEIGFFKHAFSAESRAYRKLRASKCPSVPSYYGNCKDISVIYPTDCIIPEEDRLCGPQRGIMLQYLEGEDVTVANFTHEIGQKAIKSLRLIHDLKISHGDIYHGDVVRNLRLLKNGEVRWIDFVRSRMPETVMLEEQEEHIAEEFSIAEESFGLKGATMKLVMTEEQRSSAKTE